MFQLLWVTGLLLAAEPTGPRLANLSIDAVNVDPKTAAFFQEHFLHALETKGLRVVSSREIAELIGIQRQRALLGCSAESDSCLTEFADALGTDGAVRLRLGKIGSSWVFDAKATSRVGDALGLVSKQAKNEDDLLKAVESAASELASLVKNKVEEQARAAKRAEEAEKKEAEAKEKARLKEEKSKQKEGEKADKAGSGETAGPTAAAEKATAGAGPSPLYPRSTEPHTGVPVAAWILGGIGLAATAPGIVLAVIGASTVPEPIYDAQGLPVFDANTGDQAYTSGTPSLVGGLVITGAATALLVTGIVMGIVGYVPAEGSEAAPVAVGFDGQRLFVAGTF